MTMADKAIRDVETEELEAGLRDGSIQIVDVRETGELAGGVIPGSWSMPLSGFEPTAIPPAEGKRIVFSCASGVRSRLAIAACRRAEVDLTEHYRPGFKGWVASGGSVEPAPE